MKRKEVWICDFCQAESEDKDTILLCEAKHIGLKTIDDYQTYSLLKFEANRSDINEILTGYAKKSFEETNADRIRRMTNQELSSFIDSITNDEDRSDIKYIDDKKVFSSDIMEWLESPALTHLEVMYNAIQDISMEDFINFEYQEFVMIPDDELSMDAQVLKGAWKIILERMKESGVLKVV